MTAFDLVAELRSRGVELSAVGDRLRCEGPDSALTDDVLGELTARRPEILELLADEGAIWPPRPDDLASWPVARREMWGIRANELEGQGLSWRDAERRAYAETAEAMAAEGGH
jgi:hypothetical protein